MANMANDLTISEAVQFIEGVLQIDAPFDKFKTDKVAFLNDVISTFRQKIPFQSVTAIATPKPERRSLTFEEIKACMMTRQGGLCFELNYFMKVLLERLGFEVFLAGWDAVGKQNNHLSVVVRSLRKSGDLHLIEAGIGFPVFEAIPLDFEKESPVYQSGFLTHKYVRAPDGTIRWMHKANENYRPTLVTLLEDGWYTFMSSALEFREIEYFAASMENVRTVESGPEALTPLLLSPRAVDFRYGKLFAIKDTTIMEENDIREVTKKRIQGPDELLEAYRVHFPQFPREMIQQVMQIVSLEYKNN